MILLFAVPRPAHAQSIPAAPSPTAAPTPSTPAAPDATTAPGIPAGDPTGAPAVPDAPVGPAAPDEPPRITHQHPPVYPDVPKPQQKPVDVVVHVAIDASGAASAPRVVSPANPAFDDLAIASALDATFTPARRAGQPVAGELDVTVHFDPQITGGETISITDRLSAIVRGHATAPSVGAQDIRVQAGQLATAIPHQNGATGLLQWAPGFLLTNEGGEGHAEQIFLRGFDAREGQDLEMRVNGDVVNQAGNLHGNGYADLHFILPELVESLRVVEGPYDPRQGNFAVAGSADYELGLARRGLSASYELGSFGTRRALLLFGPPGASSHNFGGVELYQTDGFGQNRDARRATALGQTETKLGNDGIARITAGLYLTDYHSAGVIREDDYAAHERDPATGKGFYDTYDFGQGGAAGRVFVLADLETQHADGATLHNQVSLTAQTLRLRENFTGYLLDQQTPFQQPHPQRGDLIDLESDAITAQLQGFARQTRDVLGVAQHLELGYFARLDRTSGQQYRDEAANGHPYAKDSDLDATLGDLGLYAALDADLGHRLVLRGGVRSDLLTYNVIDNCAVHDVAHPSKLDPPGDASCLDQEQLGNHREPVQRASTAGAVVLPRASLLAGPFAGVTASISYGEGVRSIDPSYITQDVQTPFARIQSYDAGASYAGRPGELDVALRASAFRTHVDRDLIFSETVGRNVLAGGTTRLGGSLSGRATGRWLDQNASVTVVHSSFDDTGLLIPYVPDVIVRSDTAVFGQLPWTVGDTPLRALGGLGITYVGPRALPFGERSDPVVTLDGSLQISWAHTTLAVKAANLLDTRYRLGEYNDASDFRSQAQPTLAVARQFTAGAPRTVLVQLEVHL
jgi:TonB family protein